MRNTPPGTYKVMLMYPFKSKSAFRFLEQIFENKHACWQEGINVGRLPYNVKRQRSMHGHKKADLLVVNGNLVSPKTKRRVQQATRLDLNNHPKSRIAHTHHCASGDLKQRFLEALNLVFVTSKKQHREKKSSFHGIFGLSHSFCFKRVPAMSEQ